MKRRLINFCTLLALLTPGAGAHLFAQSDTGSIAGQVSDPSGAAVVGATVTITDLGTNNALKAQTGNNGAYAFSTLRASCYKIVVDATGFKQTVLAQIEVHTQDALSENITLSVGSPGESVTVTADVGEIETSASVATTVDRVFVENMPLSGRSFQALIALTPGNVTAKTYYTSAGQFSIDGQRTDANYFSIDGVSANVGITQGSNVYLGAAGRAQLRFESRDLQVTQFGIRHELAVDKEISAVYHRHTECFKTFVCIRLRHQRCEPDIERFA